MNMTYRLDVRYVPENGVRVLDRLQRLIEAVTDAGFEATDGSVFDDGMRLSLQVTSTGPGRPELKLLTAVAGTGTIGRFSCRQSDPIVADQPEKSGEEAESPVFA